LGRDAQGGDRGERRRPRRVARLRGSAFCVDQWSAEKFPLARTRFSFLEWFEGIVVSGEERLKKPDPRIYWLAVERFGLEPPQTLYVDDAPANIAAAALVGFKTYRLVGAPELRGEFVACGLLPG
jgi:2-haloacid dehalogenase